MATSSPTAPLQRVVDQARGQQLPVLVLHDARCEPLARSLTGPGVERVPIGPKEDLRRPWAAVLLLARDIALLRRAISVLPPLGRTRVLACWLDEAASQPPLLVPRPEWPAVTRLTGRLLPSGAALTVLEFGRRVEAAAVLQELGRSTAPAPVRYVSPGVLAARDAALEAVPPADPRFRAVTGPDAGLDPATDVPVDVVLDGSPGQAPEDDFGAQPAVQEVTGRPPVVVRDPALVAGPLDEAVLNPRGFVRRPAGPVVRLADVPGVDPTAGVTARVVAGLREHAGVQVTWDEAPVERVARTVAGLAMAGVPVLTDHLPAAAEELLGPDLSGTLAERTDRTDLADALEREELSVRQRRAALLTHSTLGWRNRLMATAGHQTAFPSCSVVLTTKREELLPFALRQVSRQRGVDAELVLVAHGFEPDLGLVREHAGGAVTVVPVPASTRFGEAIAAGVRHASGELLAKMDDDDWYGPHHLLDLLLARQHSGADIVGTPAEFVYVEALDLTVRRNDPSEVYAQFVAGGTLLLDRVLLDALGGFRPVHRFVDLQLLDAARAAGVTVYRAHGLNYVLRRTAGGHTWAADADYFRDPRRLDSEWPGFAPSAVLEADHEAS